MNLPVYSEVVAANYSTERFNDQGGGHRVELTPIGIGAGQVEALQ